MEPRFWRDYITHRKVNRQSFVEVLYDREEAAALGNRLSDHCPVAVDLSLSG